jgi:hypothetical protein
LICHPSHYSGHCFRLLLLFPSLHSLYCPSSILCIFSSLPSPLLST